jgi:nucleotidyltransferase/DNA polymerase involved in DNA repair
MRTTDSLDKRDKALRELREIPGIGPSLAADLYSLGIRRIADLKRKNPETLYRRLEKLTGAHQDRCVLYTFRCAAYYARTAKPVPRLLLWWNWMDAPKPASKARRAWRRR